MSHLTAKHGHDGNIASDGLAKRAKNLRSGASLLTTDSRLKSILLRDSKQPNGCLSSQLTLLGYVTSNTFFFNQFLIKLYAMIMLKKCDGGTRTQPFIYTDLNTSSTFLWLP